MALRQISKPAPILIVMSGLSGSGKTRVSAELMAAMPAIRLRSDVERKRIFGLDETAGSGSAIDAGIYTPASSRRVYAHLIATARSILETGHNVILDAAFLRPEQCERALLAAQQCAVPAVIVRVEAPVEILRERLRRRARAATDASEADLAVLDHQLATAEPLTARVEAHVIVCDNSGDVDIAALKRTIKRHADTVRRR
jgi:predicted kinase